METDNLIKPLLFKELLEFDRIDKVIIESLEQALYRVEVEIKGQVYYVLESPGKILSRRSILQIQEILMQFTIGRIFLRHVSPYDEMIGLEENAQSNQLLIPIGNFFEDMPENSIH
jgi:hypothetical protein